MQAIVPYSVFGVVKEVGNVVRLVEGFEDLGQKARIIAATGFEDQLARSGTLIPFD